MTFATTTTTFGLRLPLLQLLLWVNHFALVTCQSTSGGGGYDVSNVAVGSTTGKTSQVFPEDGHVQFADSNDAPPPPTYPDVNHDQQLQPPMEATRTPNGLEILVAIFFFVAAAWLLVAVFYALLALLVLRLRARGQLNLTDETFGRLYLFGSRRFYFPCGCLLRRYVIAFGHDQANRRRSRSDDSRYMSRSERRSAIEEILFGSGTFTISGGSSKGKVKQQQEQQQVDEEMGSPMMPTNHSQNSSISSDEGQTNSTLLVSNTQRQHGTISADNHDAHSHSSEELVCSICLGGYDVDDNIFYSEVCDHVFHANCILDWLERRNNTDCPCCRQPLVSEDIVWEVVKGNRKLKEKKEKKARKAKKEGRGWRLASLDSEVASARSYIGEREGTRSSHDQQPGSQGTVFTLPEAAEDTTGSGLDTSIESAESQDYTANTPGSANPLDPGILEPSPYEEQDEEAPPAVATERRSDASSSSDDDTTFSTVEAPTKNAKPGSRTRGEDDNEKRDPPCEPDAPSSPNT